VSPILSSRSGILSGMGLRNAGSLVGSVALCLACETVIGFVLWGVDYALVKWLGRMYFNWGKL